MVNIFEFYKPLRNHLREVCLDDSLYVVWAYIQHIQFNCAFPLDIEVNSEFLRRTNRASKGIYSWELELIAREAIINCCNDYGCSKTLKSWSYLSRTMGNLKFLENAIGQKYVDTDNILIDLHRNAHRQFPWQDEDFRGQLTRYYKIFSRNEIDKIVQETIGIKVYQLYLLGFLLLSVYYKETPAVLSPIRVTFEELDISCVDNFMKFFSRDVSSLRELLKSEQRMDETYAYSFSSLRAFPLIHMTYRKKQSIVCPLPPLLLRRITAGLYYEVLNKDGFDVFFGESYQRYVGEVLNKANTYGKLTVIPESEYYVKKRRKDTIDWIASSSDAALFIECKTKRMILQAKVELIDTTALENEMESLSRFVVQIYKTILDYIDGKYPNYVFDQNRKIYPILVTLEDWYLSGYGFYDDLRALVEKMISSEGMPINIMTDMPYSICSIDEFEKLMQIINIYCIQEVMNGKVNNKERITWNFRPYLNSCYREDIDRLKYIFDDDTQQLFERMKESVGLKSC